MECRERERVRDAIAIDLIKIRLATDLMVLEFSIFLSIYI